MKSSLNPGPFVGHTHHGFRISTAHIRAINTLLLDWEDSLPREIADYVRVVTVNPTTITNCPAAVSILVILSGAEAGGWESKFELRYVYSPNGDGAHINQNELTNGVRRAIELEHQKHLLAANRLGSMVGKLEIRY